MRYRNDPRWITAKWASKCACSNCCPIKPGDKVFYYPLGKSLFVGECAQRAAGDFQAARFDEECGL
jgi:hypothetical protein